MLKKFLFHQQQAALWILVWFAIALLLRLTHLTVPSLWMDEVATVLFSLGNSSHMIPLNELISIEQLLRPLQVTPGATAMDVVKNLLAEDNHPPAYFVIAHAWMQLFHRSDGYASVWAARSLPAIFGALGVPAMYLLAWTTFQNRTIGLLCGALIAVSPLDVFLSQEARHYTLAILMVIASLSCFALSVRALTQKKAIHWTTGLSWVLINSLSISIHYFCGITLLAEALTLLLLLIQQCRSDASAWRQAHWLRIYSAAVGTFASAVIWLPLLLNFYGSPQSSFLKSGAASWQYWINPIVQSLAGWLYAVLSPITSGYGTLAVVAIVTSCLFLLVVYAPWLIRHLKRSLSFQLRQPDKRTGIQSMGGFFLSANILFLLICYGLGFDITRGHRYSFVFFPSILILVGAALAPFWQNSSGPILEPLHTKILESIKTAHTPTPPHRSILFERVKLPFIKQFMSGKAFVISVIFIGFLGSQVIVNDASSLKFYKANRLVNLVRSESTYPIIVGTETTVTAQPMVIGIEIMSAGWELKRQLDNKLASKLDGSTTAQRWPEPPQFVIAENNAAKGFESRTQLIQSLSSVSRPFDLWLLNMSPELKNMACARLKTGNKGSFSYVHYVCKSP